MLCSVLFKNGDSTLKYQGPAQKPINAIDLGPSRTPGLRFSAWSDIWNLMFWKVGRTCMHACIQPPVIYCTCGAEKHFVDLQYFSFDRNFRDNELRKKWILLFKILNKTFVYLESSAIWLLFQSGSISTFNYNVQLPYPNILHQSKLSSQCPKLSRRFIRKSKRFPRVQARCVGDAIQIHHYCWCKSRSL